MSQCPAAAGQLIPIHGLAHEPPELILNVKRQPGHNSVDCVKRLLVDYVDW
jgi:hypothetical protein